MNWTGLCIEPNPMYLPDLVSHRTCDVFVNPVSKATGEEVTFRMQNVYGGIVGSHMDNHETAHGKGAATSTTVTLTTVTLSQVLKQFNMPKVIEYLSLDVEGAEDYVMQGFKFDYIFLLITVERPPPSFHELIVPHGYHFERVMSQWGDVIYLHETHPKFHEIMSARKGVGHTGFSGVQHQYLLTPEYVPPPSKSTST